MSVIIDRIGDAAMLEQLAEECTELAHEALKLARIKRGENPTPASKAIVKQNLITEFTDVMICADELGLRQDFITRSAKMMRFMDRWESKGD